MKKLTKIALLSLIFAVSLMGFALADIAGPLGLSFGATLILVPVAVIAVAVIVIVLIVKAVRKNKDRQGQDK